MGKFVQVKATQTNELREEPGWLLINTESIDAIYRLPSGFKYLLLVNGGTFYMDDEYAEKILNGTAEIGACSAVFQKDLIGNLRFNTAIRHNEDKLFLFEYVAENEGTIICSNQKLYGYYKRVGSATKSGFSLNLLDVIRANRIIYERTEQRFPQYMQQAAFNLMVARLSVLKAIIDAGVYQENKELFRKIKGNVLRTSCKGASAKRRLERAALLIGDLLYIVCVKVYRTIRKFFGKETAEKVRKVVGKKG